MQNNILALLVPNAAQIITEADRDQASNEITGGSTIWFDADRIAAGVVLWAVPGAGWCLTTQVSEYLVVLHARQDGSPTRGNHLNRLEVGFGRPTLNQHWECLRACLVSK